MFSASGKAMNMKTISWRDGGGGGALLKHCLNGERPS